LAHPSLDVEELKDELKAALFLAWHLGSEFFGVRTALFHTLPDVGLFIGIVILSGDGCKICDLRIYWRRLGFSKKHL